MTISLSLGFGLTGLGYGSVIPAFTILINGQPIAINSAYVAVSNNG